MTEKPSIYSDLSAWYLDGGRFFFEKYSSDRLAAFDSDFERLQKLDALSEKELTVCFLGSSGVGKSTLINVLVADGRQVLPQGGVGPLTAQATIVKHSKDQRLRAKYLPSKHYHRMLFALARWHELETKSSGREVDLELSASAAEELDEDDRREVETAIPADPADSPEEVSSGESKIDSYTRRVSLLISGDQFKTQDKPYLIDSLSECLGRERLLGTVAQPDDSERIKKLREVIALASDKDHIFEFRSGSDRSAFFHKLKEHASGFLAPAISTLEVLVDAPCLKNRLVFVDLPGLGVANDDYQTVTNRWIREAKAVVLVVDRSGIAESSAQLLQSTGFLTNLLHDSHDLDAPRKHLIVAVVKIDTSADDARAQDKSFPPPEGVRRWVEYFGDACNESSRTISEQLKVELKKIYEDGGEATRVERRHVMDEVLETLQVHPVSAIDYRKFVVDDEDEPPRIKKAEASRIPQLRDALVSVGNENVKRLCEGLESATGDVHEKAKTAIQLTLAKWEQEERAQEEAQSLRAELEQFIKPLQKEYHHRQGEFRNHLHNVVPVVIANSVSEASMSALRDIEKYLKKLEKVHWATLRAAVRRGGAFVGSRKVDLPVDITLRFEEPIAVAWSKDVLKSTRRRTLSMGKEQTFLVGKIADWARGQGTRVKPTLVEALHNDLNAQTKELGNVGKEAIAELKEKVRTELYEKVEVCVRRNCQKFVRRKQDVGIGVKNRMHEFLRQELAHAVVDAAKPVALEVLDRNYRVVSEEVRGRFRELPDPIEAAVDAIVNAEEEFIRRSDAQKRKGVIREAAEHLERLEELEIRNQTIGGPHE